MPAIDSISKPFVESTNQISNTSAVVGEAYGRKRRTRIKEKPNHSVNLWSIMKNCIGKDLSKIPMPGIVDPADRSNFFFLNSQ